MEPAKIAIYFQKFIPLPLSKQPTLNFSNLNSRPRNQTRYFSDRVLNNHRIKTSDSNL